MALRSWERAARPRHRQIARRLRDEDKYGVSIIASLISPARTFESGPANIVYYHAGGWLIADLDVYDAAPCMPSKQLDAVVVSVEYRHAPEFKFAAQHEDAVSAYRWVLSNARSWGGDVNRMAFAGESAGGNLAINTVMAARDARLPMPRGTLSV